MLFCWSPQRAFAQHFARTRTSSALVFLDFYFPAHFAAAMMLITYWRLLTSQCLANVSSNHKRIHSGLH